MSIMTARKYFLRSLFKKPTIKKTKHQMTAMDIGMAEITKGFISVVALIG